MTDDLITRLREVSARAANVAHRKGSGDESGMRIVSIPAQDTDVDVVCAEAVDEIERLRAENERLKAELRLSTDIMEEILAEVLSNPLCPDRTFDAVTSVQIQGNKEALGYD